MTAAEPLEREPATAHRTVAFDSLTRVLRTARMKPAIGAKNRTQHQLVCADNCRQQASHLRRTLLQWRASEIPSSALEVVAASGRAITTTSAAGNSLGL